MSSSDPKHRQVESARTGGAPTVRPPDNASDVDEQQAPRLLSERARRGIATALVAIALVHVALPKLAIDAIFLGLLAFAALVLLFDIDSVEWLGVKARRRALKQQTDTVKSVEISSEPVKPSLPPIDAQAHQAPEETIHGEPNDLMPPVDRVERLLWAAEQIRIELILLAGNGGYLPKGRAFASYRALELASLLASKNMLPDALVEPIRTVVEQRNAVAHAAVVNTSVVQAAAQLALEVLAKLREVPRNWNRVLGGAVPLFSDRSLSSTHPASPGVMIEQIDHDGKRLSLNVFPVVGELKRGRFVTWDWDFARVFDEEAWYTHPETGKPTVAFSSAASFAGREYPDQWGVQYRVNGPMEL